LTTPSFVAITAAPLWLKMSIPLLPAEELITREAFWPALMRA
jgi:hypothetical protein